MPGWRMIYLLGQEKTTRPLKDVFVFVLYVDISLFFCKCKCICKSCCWVIYLVDQEKTSRLFKNLCLSLDDKLYYPFFTLDWSFIPSHSHQTNTNLLFERKSSQNMAIKADKSISAQAKIACCLANNS